MMSHCVSEYYCLHLSMHRFPLFSIIELIQTKAVPINKDTTSKGMSTKPDR